MANPDSFKLGGESVDMTAIFTDIQKFSSFSELLTAGELVAFLNYYLTKMSDIIMSEDGTIDKYEGDAIIALVGAPLKMPDNAERAVKAAFNTMMGNNVNLASRLEGVNRQYSTFGILVSEATYRKLGSAILCRRLDKVQVVNVNTPLTLYELLATAEQADEALKAYVADW